MKSPALKERQIDELTNWKWNAFHSLSFTFSREIRISFLGTLSFTVVIFSRYNFFYSDNFCTKNFCLENRMQTGVKNRWREGKILNFNSGLLGVFLNIYSTRTRFIENKFNWYEWWKNKTEQKQNKDHNVILSMVCAQRVYIVKWMHEGSLQSTKEVSWSRWSQEQC